MKINCLTDVEEYANIARQHYLDLSNETTNLAISRYYKGCAHAMLEILCAISAGEADIFENGEYNE